MELAFGKGPRGKRWKDCGAKLVILAQTLKESPPPSWIDLSTRKQNGLDSLVNATYLASFSNDSEDKNCSFPSLAVDSSSLTAPSTSASATAPSSQVAATATSRPSSQELPASSIATAAQIPEMQSELGEARCSLEALTINRRMSTPFFFIKYLTKPSLSASRQHPCHSRGQTRL